MKYLAIAAIGLMALTGCEQSVEDSPEDAPEAYPATYSSVEELRDAFVQAGGICPEWEQKNHVKLAAESGTCSDSNVMSVYISEAQKDEAVNTLMSITESKTSLLVGENWIINDKQIDSIDREIGGVFVTRG